jgi:hypothetical protein
MKRQPKPGFKPNWGAKGKRLERFALAADPIDGERFDPPAPVRRVA